MTFSLETLSRVLRAGRDATLRVLASPAVAGLAAEPRFAWIDSISQLNSEKYATSRIFFTVCREGLEPPTSKV